MILQCDQCNAKFRLDDSKIKESGIKVRCSKCKHVFFVSKEASQDEADFDSILSGLGSSAEQQSSDSLDDSTDFEAPAEQGAVVEEQSAASQSLAARGEAVNLDFSDEKPSAEVDVPLPSAAEDREFDFDEFSFDEGPVIQQEPAVEVVEQPSVDELSSTIDYASLLSESEDMTSHATSTSTSEEFTFDVDSSEDKFGADFFAGEATVEERFESRSEDELAFSPVSQQPTFHEEPEEAPSISVEKDSDTGSFPLQEDSKPAEPDVFDFGALDFGEVAEVAPVVEEKENIAQAEVEKQKSPLAFAEESIPLDSSPVPVPAVDELPPLSISSRRKGLSLFPLTAIVVAVLLILAIGGVGIYFMKSGPALFNQMGLGFMAKWFGIEASEEGSIAIINPTAAFYHNREAGEIFVVSGEAVNNFKKPRASIHVKVSLLESKGAILLSKGAYCGNNLSKEQLATLPMAKMEEAMNNQFGDSLSNLSVKPGKGIPFVIVFANVPKEAADFALEITGSTVAGQ